MIRNRLLVLCIVVHFQLACRAVLVTLGLTRSSIPMTYMVFSNVMICLWGFFDSIIVGKLCGSASSRPSASADVSALRRRRRIQTTDSRIRMGSSVTTESYFDNNNDNGSGGCESIKEQEEGSPPTTTIRAACDSTVDEEDEGEEGPPPPTTTTTTIISVDLESLNEAQAWL